MNQCIIFNSDDDGRAMHESVQHLKAKLPRVVVQDFHGYGHFTLGSMKTDAFPELLEVLTAKEGLE